MWIDGVFSGGGVKAFAFVGALEVTEKAGFRFARLAGTSAGSIIAALLAAGYDSDDIKQHMEDLQPKLFMDNKTSFFRFPFFKWLTLYWRMGLYKGDVFESWVRDLLKQKGIESFSDLPPDTLKIVVSDLTRGKMVVIPDDLVDYGIDPLKFSVARAIRISCSLPFFFEPVTLYNQQAEKCVLVDGGVLSNFPVWIFDEQKDLPLRPFLGLQLSSKQQYFKSRKIKNAVDLFHGLFETMKEAHDTKYISKYAASNIIFLPVDQYETADFKLTKEDQEQLMDIGRERAKQFFKRWTY
nr:patatin-like phospholipase family protein [Tuberibacillus sp. Marseille-P3662]